MPFLANSRYHDLPTVDVQDARGRPVKALKLRRLGDPRSKPRQVEDGERLDLIASDRYSDATRFWHIADANTEIWANDLVAETGRTIEVPEET
jgi:hypothetical protein